LAPEERGEDLTPIVSPTDQDCVIGEICVGDERAIRRVRVLRVTERSNAATEERLKSGHPVGTLSII
jgi:hypothetical protein